MTTIFKIDKEFRFVYAKQKHDEKNWALELNDSGDDLKITSGFVAVVGYSGSGKSTLLSILSGFEPLKQASHIDYGDKNYANGVPQKDFGFIFQQAYESKALSAADNVALPLYLEGQHNKSSLVDYTKELLQTLGLGQYDNAQANELSGGQLSRLGILRGLAKQPKVLFADEPAGSLDPFNADKVVGILRKWQENQDSTVIMVTHHHEHAFKYADQIIMLGSDGTESTASKVLLNKHRPATGWTDSDKAEITRVAAEAADRANSQGLDIQKSDVQIEDLPALPKPSKMTGFSSHFNFLNRVAWKNVISTADSSRNISLISGILFFVLFGFGMIANQWLNWFEIVNEHRNESTYLRIFDVKSDKQPYLSDHVRETIEQTTVAEMEQWHRLKVMRLIEDLGKTVVIKAEEPKQNAQFVTVDTTVQTDPIPESTTVKSTILSQALCADNTTSTFSEFCSNSLLNKNIAWQDLILLLETATHRIEKKITNTDRNASTQKEARLFKQIQYVIDVVRQGESLSHLDADTKAAQIYPTFQTGWRFLNAENEESDLTEVHWLHADDPLFNTKQLIEIINTPKFTSNDQPGVILSKSFLYDTLNHPLTTTMVNVKIGTERVCIPVVAIVDTMPGFDYKAITPINFGLKMSEKSYHCPENRRYYKVLVNTSTPESIKTKVLALKDTYGNTLFSVINTTDDQISLYAEQEDKSMTESEWNAWLTAMEVTDYTVLILAEWEYNNNPSKDAPYQNGHVFAAATSIVPAVAYYLEHAYTDDKPAYEQWKIKTTGYHAKLSFAAQTQKTLSAIKTIGPIVGAIFLFGFVAFYALINLSIKMTEMAIFRSMGSRVLTLGYIFTLQLVLVVLGSAFLSFMFIFSCYNWIKDGFSEYIIRSVWENSEEQQAAIRLLENSSEEGMWYMERFLTVWQSSYAILGSGIMIVIIFSMVFIALNASKIKNSTNALLKQR